jgi:hypothetical protein
LIQKPFVEVVDRLAQLRLQGLVPGAIDHALRPSGSGFHIASARENAADLAHRHAALDPAHDAADRVDVSLRIKAVPALGARRSDQPVTTFPGTQRDRIDTGQARYLTDGKQRFMAV